MSLDVTNIPIPNRPFAVIDHRITTSTEAGSGTYLEGVFYDREGTIEPLGADNLPMIQILDMTSEEKQQAGAMGDGSGNAPTYSEDEVIILVCGNTEDGFVDRTPDDPNTLNGVRDWCSRLMDIIEREYDEEGEHTVDATLQGTVRKPITMKLGEMYMSQMVMAVEVRVSFETVAYWRGGRTE